MFESVKIQQRLKENMKDDEELELLLGEIPHAIHHPYNFSNVHQYPHDHVSHQDGFDEMMNNDIGMKRDKGNNICMYNEDTLNHHKFTCASSPVSGFSLQSDGSSSSLFSGVHLTSDNVSPTSSLEELRPNLLNGSSKNHNVSSKDLEASDAPAKKLVNGSTIDEGGLSKNLSQMYINDHKEFVPVGLNCVPNHDQSVKEAVFQINPEKRVASANNMFGISNYGVSQSCIPKGLQNVDVDKDPTFIRNVNFGSHYSTTMSDLYGSPSTFVNPAMNPRVNGVEHAGQFYHMGFPLFEFPETLAGPLITDGAHYAKQNGMKPYERMGAFISPMVPHLIPHNPQFKVENAFSFQPQVVTGKSQVPHAKLPQWKVDALTKGKSLVQGLNYTMGKSREHHKVHNSIATFQGSCRQKHQDKRSFLEHRPRFQRMPEIGRNDKMHCAFTLPSKFNSLVEAEGYIYYIAKDQHGCRYLQRMFDEGTPGDVQIIFNEIIAHVIELMINPFGNYLMQKLLEVCNEEQRMQILLKVTQEPGELVRISLNTHGTRVVQKLIETLKTRHQVSLVISALEPGFIALIKDLNGNHVVQRCLQCLSNEDNKFIFVAAAKYCVDIATHQHGCCVLQRCISHSAGEHQDNLLAEISTNGLLLAQDAFGNYVVQFILELKIPSVISKLVSQFEGSYVHLSKQKFSSHVVEKCLSMCGDKIQSTIIQELLCETHFEQLLQDPHANYVIQTAVRVTEGPLLDLLLDAIESHKTISRNSPYSKRIFSHKLLKK